MTTPTLPAVDLRSSTLAVIDARGDVPAVLQIGENTAEAARYAASAASEAALAEAAAEMAAAFTNYFSTRSAGVSGTATGSLFSTDESGVLIVYRRTGTAPNYVEVPFPAVRPVLATAISGLRVPAVQDVIQTSGHSVPGYGAALYARCASTPSANEQAAGSGFWLFQSADGAWWRLNEEEVPNTYQFGVRADASVTVDGSYNMTATGTDDTAAMQAALNFACYFSTKQNGRLRILAPRGKVIKTTDTLHVGYGNEYLSVILEGSGSFPRNGNASAGSQYRSAIFCTQNDRPVLNIQGCRRVVVRDLALLGVGTAWMNQNNAGTMADRTSRSNWWPTQFRSYATNTQYRPYCGFAIDAYSSAAPGSAYPTVNYPTWTGYGAAPGSQYNKGATSQVIFDNCTATGFEVGWAVQPNTAGGSALNGDFIRWDNCDNSFNIHGFALGHGDARLLTFNRTLSHYCYNVLETERYGRAQANVHAQFTNCSFDNCYQIYNTHLDPTDQQLAPSLHFLHCYTEGLYSLGVAKQDATSRIAVAACEVRFTNCQLNLDIRTSEYTPVLHHTGRGYVGLFLDDCQIGGIFGGLITDSPVRGQFRVTTPKYNPFSVNSTFNDGASTTSLQRCAGRIASSFLAGIWGTKARDRVACAYYIWHSYQGYSTYKFIDGDALDVSPLDTNDIQGQIVPWFTRNIEVDGRRMAVHRLKPTVLDRASYSLKTSAGGSAGVTQANGIEFEFYVDRAYIAATVNGGRSTEPDYYCGLGDIVQDNTTGQLFYVLEYSKPDATYLKIKLRQITGLRNNTGASNTGYTTNTTVAHSTGTLTFYNARRCYPGLSRVILLTTTSGSGTVSLLCAGSETAEGTFPEQLSPCSNLTGAYPYWLGTAKNARSAEESVFPYGQFTALNTSTGSGTINQNARRTVAMVQMPLVVKVIA